MIPAEGILAGVVERQYARDAYGVLQRDRQRGTQTAGLVRIVAVTRFHGRIAVDDGLTGFRYPARQTYPNECCGAMLGSIDATGKTVCAALPLENAFDGVQVARYELRPQDLLAADKAAHQRHMDLIG